MSGHLPSVVPFLLSILTAGGGGGVIAWLIIKIFGDKWLSNKFSESLEGFKHAKNRRSKISDLRLPP
jgi:hypothetical protein